MPLTTELTSQKQHFKVSLALESEPSLPIGQYHTWLLTLRDAKQSALHPATISIVGGMPGHGHGLPTQPQVTDHLGKGVYRIEGLKFHMPGEWQLRFDITAAQLRDHVIVTIHIAP